MSVILVPLFKDHQVTQATMVFLGLLVTRDHKDIQDNQAHLELEVLAQVVTEPQVSLEHQVQKERKVAQAYRAMVLKDCLELLDFKDLLALLDFRAPQVLPLTHLPVTLDSLGRLVPEGSRVTRDSKASEVTLVIVPVWEEAPLGCPGCLGLQEALAALGFLAARVNLVTPALLASMALKELQVVLVKGVTLDVRERRAHLSTQALVWG